METCNASHLRTVFSSAFLFLPRSVKIYGAWDKRSQLEPLLLWATPRQAGFANTGAGARNVPAAPLASGSRGAPMPSSSQRPAPGQTPAQLEAARKRQETLAKAAELKQMLNNLEKVDDEGRRSSLLDELLSTDDILNLPVHPNPPGIKNGTLTVDLLKHQVSVPEQISAFLLTAMFRVKPCSGP